MCCNTQTSLNKICRVSTVSGVLHNWHWKAQNFCAMSKNQLIKYCDLLGKKCSVAILNMSINMQPNTIVDSCKNKYQGLNTYLLFWSERLYVQSKSGGIFANFSLTCQRNQSDANAIDLEKHEVKENTTTLNKGFIFCVVK